MGVEMGKEGSDVAHEAGDFVGVDNLLISSYLKVIIMEAWAEPIFSSSLI
jgi:cation transport ATPase